MKVLCVDGECYSYVTRGNVYEVASERDNCYSLMVDTGNGLQENWSYLKKHFRVVKDEKTQKEIVKMHVRCCDTSGIFESITYGKIYDVTRETKRGYVIFNDNDKESEYLKEFFQKISEENKKMEELDAIWFVVNSHLPTTITCPHYSYESAETEAKRLAHKHHGQKFIVVKALRGFEVNNIVETRYVEKDDIPF
jgi:RNAse (barnase) inhibitor barstar